MTHSLISIVMPTFNSFQYIEETIRSVIYQHYLNWELIIVDDGSTDSTEKLINEYVLQDARIKFYRRDSYFKGGSICRNIGIKKSCGEFVMFLDSDDLLTPHCLNERLKTFNKYPHCNFIVFQMGVLNVPDARLTKYKDNYLYAFLKHDLPWTITATLWKKDFLDLIGGFDEQYPRLQDPEIHTRALLMPNVQFEVCYQNQPDSLYRQNYKQINLINLLSGFQLYIQNITPRLNKRFDEKDCKSALNQSRKAAIFHVIRYFSNQNINELRILTKSINSTAVKYGIISRIAAVINNFVLTFYLIFPFNKNKTIKWIFLKFFNKIL